MTPHVLALCCGFLSLSCEILWVRLFGFANHSLPTSFALVLGAFLVGVAVGALAGRSACRGDAATMWGTAALAMAAAAALCAMGPVVFGAMSGGPRTNWIGLVMAAMVAGAMAVPFPIAHHLGTDPTGTRVGRSLSRVYVSNIMGSTAGPLVTGFVLLDLVTLETCFRLMAVGAVAVGAGCQFMAGGRGRWWLVLSACACVVGPAPDRLIAAVARSVGPVRQIVQNRYGVIVVHSDPANGDMVCGGNVYDGRMNLDPEVNSNKLHRLVALIALHDAPKSVLVVGLASGTWLKLLEGVPGVTGIDVVEINPGYLKVIDRYPSHRGVLKDPRVRVQFDDGRRWLSCHPDHKYDLIVMNTTVHWRAYATLLLSREFLTEVRAHVRPGGLICFNATDSPDAVKTAAAVFPHVAAYDSFVYAADHEFRPRFASPEFVAVARAITLDGRPFLRSGGERFMGDLLGTPLRTLGEVEAAAGRRLEVITDGNMITEYRHVARP